MRQKDTDFWLLGLADDIVSDIENSLPDGCRLNIVNSLSAINLQQQGPLGASILFFTPKTWKMLDKKHYRELTEQYNVHQVLVLRESRQTLESDIEEMGSFLGILYFPVSGKALENLKVKAVEIQAIYTDLHLMAREIALERELLARKNMQLEFLNRILTRSSSSLNVEEILKIAVQEFCSLLGTSGLGAIIWKKENNHGVQAEIYLPRIIDKNYKQRWKETLLTVSRQFNKQEVSSYREMELPGRTNMMNFFPSPLKQAIVPLYSSRSIFGALLAVSEQTLKLGRDQLQIINSAGNHLALALKNALKYREVRQQADYDGLTSIYNRQQFDKRLRIELKRHQRQASPLSLIMLDLDYFKNLNDTYGHLAGDMVLKKVGGLLLDTVRETDFPARYGGEEFVVILPETKEEQAWLLAERIRGAIGRTAFSYEGNRFNVTASIGVASIKPGPLTPGDTLVLQADQALYLAKNSGRNMVCTSADLCLGEAVIN